jgi:hypothetical protein
MVAARRTGAVTGPKNERAIAMLVGWILAALLFYGGEAFWMNREKRDLLTAQARFHLTHHTVRHS